MNILITRPQPGASQTAARLAEMGHTPILAPCLSITHLPAHLPEQPAALIITSAQAIPALPASLHQTPVFCVGDATAAKLRAAGFARVESAAGDAHDLRRLITARRLAGTHLLATGQRHGLALTRHLRAAGIPVLRRKVYAAHQLRALPPAATAALAAGEIALALFYSAASARAFIKITPQGTQGTIALALSPAVATPLHGLPWREIRVAVHPSEADLMALFP